MDTERKCETCRYYLGDGCCRMDLEDECAAGGFEAWEAKTMADREIVMRGLWCCTHPNNCDKCPEADCLTYGTSGQCVENLLKMAYELIEGQHRLQVHNIGNVDIPDGVSEEDFNKVMNNVADALEHTERGESWPYESTCGPDYCEIGGDEH